jgi:hypothetical protein
VTEQGYPRAVLEKLRELAVRRALPQTLQFLDSLPDRTDGTILLLTTVGVDGSDFLDYVKGKKPRTPILAQPLELVASNPGLVASHNWVAVVLRCGELLTPDVIEVVHNIRGRPPGSYLIVLTGASMITDREDYDLVARGIWRLLVGDPRVDWAGQDLAAAGCQLWSLEPVSEDIAAEVRQGVAVVDEWLTSSAQSAAPLEAVRAAHALALAESEFGAQLRPPVAGEERARRIDLLNASARAADEVRVRLVRRLDADEASVERAIASSLQLLEQDLLKDVGAYLNENKARLSSIPERKEVLVSYVTESLRQWREQTLTSLSGELRRVADETRDLLERINWQELREIDPGEKVAREPEKFLAHFAANVSWDFGDIAGEAMARPIQGDRPAWTQHLVMAVSGGVLAAVTAVVLSPAIVAAAAGGALGAAGGGLLSKHISGASSAREANEYARRVIPVAIGTILVDIREQIRATFGPIRRDVQEGLKEIADAFTRAAEQLRPGDDLRGQEDNNSTYALLLALHEELKQGN